jgi:hypothetical protein
MEKEKRIIIPTGGDFKHNLQRAKKARDFGGLESKYILAGFGYDPNRPWILEPHDLTIKDYLLLSGVPEEKILIEDKSRNSRNNLINNLSGQKGKFYITSYPMHLERFELILDELQKQGKLNKEVDLSRIGTEQSAKDFIYGCLGEIKDVYHLDKLNKTLGEKLKSLFG